MFGNKKLFILLTALIFFIAFMGLTLNQRDTIMESSSWPAKFVRDTVSWTQGLFYTPAAYMAGFFEDVSRLRTVHNENKILRKNLDQMAADRVVRNVLEQENVRLRELLDFKEHQQQITNYKYHVAQVVSVSPDPFNQTIRVNIGSQHGIQKDWAVITADGLIGRIESVDPFHSTVTLLTNINETLPGNIAIAATVSTNESSFGMIETYNRDTRMLMMSKIAEDDPLSDGDLIITSGMGEMYPKGLIIGTVESREVGDGLTYIAEIEPAADFTTLHEVLIVEVPGWTD